MGKESQRNGVDRARADSIIRDFKEGLGAMLITEVLEIGLMVNDWEHRNELVRDVVVKEVVEKFMGSKEGSEMHKLAVQISRNR
ncbi:hypothetical protein Tco_1454860 [Tanacetum coccineum]